MRHEFADTSGGGGGGGITPELHQQLLAMHCEQPLTAAAAAKQCGITLLQFTAWLHEPRTRADLAALRFSADLSMEMFLGQQRLAAIAKLMEISHEGKGETARRASKDLLNFHTVAPLKPAPEVPLKPPRTAAKAEISRHLEELQLRMLPPLPPRSAPPPSTSIKTMGIVMLMLAACLGMPSTQHSPTRGGTVSAGEERAAVDRAGSLASPHGRLLRPRADALTVPPRFTAVRPSGVHRRGDTPALLRLHRTPKPRDRIVLKCSTLNPMKIRNFSIIAHIDHGKSTLADRILQSTGAITEREMKGQMLDDMDLERERGITIKASAVTVLHKHNGEQYMLNLIDTPGHVDFHYEVSRALKACEGALLVVDAAQGVEAQTVANAYAAIEQDLEILPVLNKVDLPAARPDEIADELESVLGFPAESGIRCSAKSGLGIDDLLAAICEKLPGPTGDPNAPAQALIFDSVYDDYRGVVTYVRMMNGTLNLGDRVQMMSTGRTYHITDMGKHMPKPVKVKKLEAGEVGFIISAIKSLDEVRIGDTVTGDLNPAKEPLPGYREPQRVVFCDFYPTGNTDFEDLRKAITRLHLNDASFVYAPESNEALGFGFRCGFLGLLHMDIIQERLEREGGVEIVQTAPTVTYQVAKTDGSVFEIHNPAELPDPSQIQELREPIVKVEFILPNESIGDIMTLCESRRGQYKKQQYLSPTRQILEYELPLAEIIFDFYDKLKSITRGYGTMDYELMGYRKDNLVKLSILVNGKPVDALSIIVHRDKAEYRGRNLLVRLKKEIDKHQFEIPLQAAIGGKIIARETIKSVGKNVTAKCYGGDVSRKRKLLEKQKEGKKRMKRVGSVDIPQEAFMSVLEPGE